MADPKASAARGSSQFPAASNADPAIPANQPDGRIVGGGLMIEKDVVWLLFIF
jgi:hypothetical protein